MCEDKYERLDLDKFVGCMESLSGVGSRVIELQGLCRAIQLRCVCSECDGGPIEVREDMHRREGLVTHPYLYCTNCGEKIILSTSTSPSAEAIYLKSGREHAFSTGH